MCFENLAESAARGELMLVDGVMFGVDAPYEAFRRSCANIYAAWHSE